MHHLFLSQSESWSVVCLCGYSDLAPRDISGTSDPFTRIIYNNLSAETSVRSSVSIHTVTRVSQAPKQTKHTIKAHFCMFKTLTVHRTSRLVQFSLPSFFLYWSSMIWRKKKKSCDFSDKNELHTPCLLCLFVAMQNLWLCINMTIK